MRRADFPHAVHDAVPRVTALSMQHGYLVPQGVLPLRLDLSETQTSRGIGALELGLPSTRSNRSKLLVHSLQVILDLSGSAGGCEGGDV